MADFPVEGHNYRGKYVITGANMGQGANGRHTGRIAVSTSNALAGAQEFIPAIGCNVNLPYHTNYKFPVIGQGQSRIQQHVYTCATISELFLGTDPGMVLSLFTVCTGNCSMELIQRRKKKSVTIFSNTKLREIFEFSVYFPSKLKIQVFLVTLFISPSIL